MTGLIQARAVLAWIRNLQSGGHQLRDIEIVPRSDADAAATAIGGVEISAIMERAREVELSIYRVSAALIAPQISEIEAEAVAAYRPFDVIELFRVKDKSKSLEMRPLVILDDAHTLHPNQFIFLQRWMARRELKVARWILMRLDALRPEDVLAEFNHMTEDDKTPGLKRSRDITEIWLQSNEDRAKQRISFRQMAKDMANRYLAQMDIFSRRRLNNLGELLINKAPSMPAKKLMQLEDAVKANQLRYKIKADRRSSLQEEIKNYFSSTLKEDPPNDLSLEMLNILMGRYSKRTPQASLFDTEEDNPDPSRPLVADSGIVDGAKIHLMHQFERPYYYGIDMLCDASSENAEQFLHLTSRLVSRIETQIIRGKSPSLGCDAQHQILRERAEEMLNQWDFPHHRFVRRLADWIGKQCVEKSLEPNASLDGGANAVGILQEEFNAIPLKYPHLALVLQFGVAYNAFSLLPNRKTKKRVWCLIELGGILNLYYGLSLKRGGFLERRSHDLVNVINGS